VPSCFLCGPSKRSHLNSAKWRWGCRSLVDHIKQSTDKKPPFDRRTPLRSASRERSIRAINFSGDLPLLVFAKVPVGFSTSLLNVLYFLQVANSTPLIEVTMSTVASFELAKRASENRFFTGSTTRKPSLSHYLERGHPQVRHPGLHPRPPGRQLASVLPFRVHRIRFPAPRLSNIQPYPLRPHPVPPRFPPHRPP
jgi:hypothetical protein